MHNEFGNRLRHLRIVKGYTQSRLAELADLHEKHISKLETGYFYPNFETLQKIAKALDISIEELSDTTRERKIVNANPFYSKCVQILNYANDKELKCFYEVLKSAKKCIDILR